MEDWVFLGDSGSDAEAVCSVDDEGSETDFAMVQLRPSHAAESRAKADGGKNQGDYQEESDYDDDYFDLDLPALSGSKAVFGANGDFFDDLDLALNIISMACGGYESGIHGADTEGDIDTMSLGNVTVHPERVVRAHCANIDTDESPDAAELVRYDDIDTGSSDDELSDDDDTDGSVSAELVNYDDTDTSSSDSWESYYDDDDELSDEDDTDGSDAARTGEPNRPSNDPKAAALHDYKEDNIAPQQRRMTAIATWRPPCAPHLYFTQRSQSTYKSIEAAEDAINNIETVSYPDTAKGDDGDHIESSDEDTVTNYSSLTHRDGLISHFVGVALARTDALVLFDNMESELELLQYSLSRSDINAWKAALGKGRAEVAARPRPPFAPHLFFTRPSRSTY